MVMSVGTYFKVEVGETLKEVPKLQQVALPVLAAPLLVSKELAILFLGSTVATYIGCHTLQENAKDQKKSAYRDLHEEKIPLEEGFDIHQRKGEVESYPSDPEGQNIKGESFPAHDQKDRFKDQGFQVDPEANKVKVFFNEKVKDSNIKLDKLNIGVTKHGVSRKIEREIKSQDEIDALKNPLKINPIIYDSLGRPSQRYIGKSAEVVINPETNNILSVNKTRENTRRKLLGDPTNLEKKDENNRQ